MPRIPFQSFWLKAKMLYNIDPGLIETNGKGFYKVSYPHTFHRENHCLQHIKFSNLGLYIHSVR